MKLNTIKEMMRAGDLREAEAALREYLKADAGSTRAKVLLGVCLHLQGDEEGASRIDRQLADGGETCAAVGKFHALKVAASCAMMVLAATAGAASDNPLEGVDLGDVPGIGEPLKPMYGISVELPVKIVFDAGGGMGTMPGKSFSVKEGASLYYTLPLCAFRKPGNLFGGWSVSSGIVEEDGQHVYPTGTRIDLSRYVPKWLMISPDGTEIDRTVVMRAIWRESMGPGDDWLLISEGGKLTADVGVEVDELCVCKELGIVLNGAKHGAFVGIVEILDEVLGGDFASRDKRLFVAYIIDVNPHSTNLQSTCASFKRKKTPISGGRNIGMCTVRVKRFVF